MTTNDTISLYDTLSPLDFRYYGRNRDIQEKLSPYLSEEALVQYLLKVEVALVKVLAKRGVCSQSVFLEVKKAASFVHAGEVYAEEDRIKHNIRALVNCIRKRVSEKAKPYIHFTTTSHDIICSADAARLRDFTHAVLLPELKSFEGVLISLAEREKKTLQIGRTHGQHAEPITFGFALAQYVSRLGLRIQVLEQASDNLRGKIAGAVGAYNASSLFIKDPVAFEAEVLAELGIKPSPISTQVVEAEFMTDYQHAVVSAFGVLANLADDMRHLQRSEIGEIAEAFEAKQVGSSTMPHKRNPINFENVKSMWKVFMPRMMTQYMDQICEHQRDLTNSASSRFVPELLAGLFISTSRMRKVMQRLIVDKESLQRNFGKSKDMVAAEPAYILLAYHNHPDAHEYVRELTLKAQTQKKPFQDLLFADKALQPYLKRFSKEQVAVLKNPEKYVGIASEKTQEVCAYWRKELRI